MSIRPRSVQSHDDPETNPSHLSSAHANRETQTKLCALLFPPSPLSEMTASNIEARQGNRVMRTCQVNSLSYLIRTRENIPQSNATVEVPTDENAFSTQQENRCSPLSSPRCTMACDTIDIDNTCIIQSHTELAASSRLKLSDQLHETPYPSMNTNQHNVTPEFSFARFRSSIRRPKRIYHRRYLSQRRRRGINHKRARQRRSCPQEAMAPSCSSSFIIAVDLHSASDHTIVARATRDSEACAELRSLLKHRSTSLEQLLQRQLQLTHHGHYRSVSILIDDDKSLEHVRTSFLHCIHSTILTSLLTIFQNKSVQLTCMNFAFFNNALYDIASQQRLRLIDTGRRDRATSSILL